jgi:hypothetical protein
MAGSNLSNQDAILQEHYGNIHWVLNTSTQVINMLPVSPKKADGRQVRELIGYGMPTSIGSYGPNMVKTPDPQTSANIEAIIQQTYRYGSIKIDWTIMHHSEGDHAYISAMRQEVERFALFEREDAERCAVGDGSGRLGFDHTTTVLTSSTPDATVALRGRIEVTSTTPVTFRQYGSHNSVFFRKGMNLEFWKDPTGDAATPSAFNTWQKRANPAQNYYTINTVTRNKSSTLASDYVEVVCNENGPGGTNEPGDDQATKWDVVTKDEAIAEDAGAGSVNATNELYGLDALIDDGNAVNQVNTSGTAQAAATFQGINAATNDFWQSEVADGTGSYFSLDLVQDVADGVSQRSGDGPEGVQFMVMHHFQARKYSLSLAAQERYPNTGSIGQFKSGTTTMFNANRTVDVCDKEIVKSRFCPKDRVYLVGKGIKHYDLKPWGWADKDGIWHRDFAYGPNYQAVAYAYKQLGTTNRMASGKIENLKTT